MAAGARRKSRGVYGVVIVALLGGALLVRARLSDSPDVYRRYLQGVQAAQQGRDAEAITLWKAVAHDQPDYPDVSLQLARAYLRTGQPDLATVELEELTRRNPAYPGAQLLLCEAYMRRRQAVPAVRAGLEAVRQQPDQADVHAALAAAYGQSANLRDCEKELLRAQQLAPDDSALFLTGAGFYQDGKEAAKTEAQARRCLALDPHNARAAYLLGWALTHQPVTPVRTQEALSVLRQAAAGETHDPRPFLELGDALLDGNQAAQAVANLERALSLAAKPDVTGGFTKKHWLLRAQIARRLSRAYSVNGDRSKQAAMLRETQSLERSAAALP